MGISASKRVRMSLSDSTEFDSACDSAYTRCVSLAQAQHAFPGVLPYQLLTAAETIHRDLSSLSFPLIVKWVPNPPSQAQIDSPLRAATRQDSAAMDRVEFKEWATAVFADCVVDGARKAMVRRIPIGIVGIAGIGAVTRSGKNLIGTAIGAYALGVATSVYLGLSV